MAIAEKTYTPRVPALDGLRGVAVLLVVLGHFYPNFEWLKGTFAPYLANWLWVGVDIFFVLSGYLITSVLLAKSLNWTNYRAFITQRFLRVAPAAYVALGVIVLLGIFNSSWIGEGTLAYFARYWWALLGFIENFPFTFGKEPIIVAHFWSLAPEFQFYVLWGALLVGLATRTRKNVTQTAIIILLVVLVTQPMIRLVCQNVLDDNVRADAIYRLTPTRLDGFAVGALLALLVNNKWTKLRQVSLFVFVLSAVMWLGCAVYEYQHDRYFVFYNNALMQTIGFSLHAWFVGGLMGMLLTRARNDLFEMRWLCWFGKISYSLYLWHFILLVLLQAKIQAYLPDTDFGLLLRYIVMITLSTSVAYLSYRLVETPVNRWRYRLKKDATTKHNS